MLYICIHIYIVNLSITSTIKENILLVTKSRVNLKHINILKY